MRLFGLGGDGGLKALKIEDYAPRIARRADLLQQILFAHADAI